jgi:heme oxygenase
MSRLKELTMEHHAKAERTSYARKLLKGMTPEEYHRYLVNQHEIYMVLEIFAHKIIDEFPEIQRALRIADDIVELEQDYDMNWHPNMLCDVVQEYAKHVSKLDKDGLLAHIYVRHFGDMYGGQMIKKRNPGSGTMYDFENVEELKAKVRSMLNDSMADEANKCFEFAIKLFEELNEPFME